MHIDMNQSGKNAGTEDKCDYSDPTKASKDLPQLLLEFLDLSLWIDVA